MSPGLILRAGIGLLATALGFKSPQMLDRMRGRVEAALRGAARRPVWCCVAAAMIVLLTRAALLVVWGMPEPRILDEFAYLLQADTFASGRLTNPSHPMGEFFETPYVFQVPSYNAKFPPGQGLALAAGQALFGHPWIGVWLSCGALAAALCWALQGYFRSAWAPAGAILILPLCIFSNWMNSYWGGAVAGIGGALAFGALPRLGRGRAWPAGILGLGAILLALTRPFEGLVVMAPLTVALLFQKPSVRQWGLLAFTGLAGTAFLGYYNECVTGSPLRMPYMEYEAQYPMTSHFNVVSPPPRREFSTPGIRWVDHWERTAWQQASNADFPLQRLRDLWARVSTFLGSALLLAPMLIFFRGWWRDRAFRPAAWALVLTVVAAFFEVLYFDHYAAPALAPLLILTVAGLRRLRNTAVTAAGPRLALTWPIAALVMSLISPASALLRAGDPKGGRELLEASLEGEFGPHLVFVRHTDPDRVEPDWQRYSRIELAPVLVEFVHNGANIDQQFVVWAHDLGEEKNRRLRQYYGQHKVWIYSPEEDPDHLKAAPER